MASFTCPMSTSSPSPPIATASDCSLENFSMRACPKYCYASGGPPAMTAAQASWLHLGARFLDDGGHEVVLGASGLSKIRTVDLSGLHPRASEVLIRVAVDVDNPLTGASGAAAVFGPQKGATLTQVREIDAGLGQLAVVIAATSHIDVTTTAGMGAAGGMPACLVGFLKAVIMPGSDLVLSSLGFAEQCENADLIITGEGSFDSQSLRGKVIEGVVRAVGDRCPIVVIAGRDRARLPARVSARRGGRSPVRIRGRGR